MLKRIFISSLLCTTALGCFSSGSEASELNARDIRMETRTEWDYQPGQGPHRRVSENDFFRPTTDLPSQPLTPPPPVVDGDWRANPPRAEDQIPVRPDVGEPRTQTSLEIGVQASHYGYQESIIPMKIEGMHGGVVAQATGAIGGQWFLRADGRFVAGAPDYNGSGKIKDTPNYIAEVRATIGRDLLWRRFGIAPYVGIGYRYLSSDLAGVSTTGAHGYLRRSQYLFAPIGLQPSMRFLNGDRLTLTAEFDPLLQGWQDTYLSDVSINEPDIRNTQTAGFGLRSDLMYKTSGWSFGPFMNYWNINASDVACGTGTGPAPITRCGYEPHNHTLEYGMQFRYRFLED